MRTVEITILLAPRLVLDWAVSGPGELLVFLLFLALWLAGIPLLYGAAGAFIMSRKGRNRGIGFVLGLLIGIGTIIVEVVLADTNHTWDKFVAGWLAGAAALVMVAAYLPARTDSTERPGRIRQSATRRSSDES